MCFRGPKATNSERARLAALEEYSILDTAPEAGYDDLTEIAAAICDVPISLVSFVAENRQWFKSQRGLGDLTETSREVSFCAHTLETKTTLIVPDAQLDPAFRDNALVTGDPKIRFYAGAPIIERNGHALGTVCVIDRQPRVLNESQVRALEALARQAGQLLEQRRIAEEAAFLTEKARAAEIQAQRSEQQLTLAVESAGVAAWYYDPVAGSVSGDERMGAFFGLSELEGPAALWLNAVVEEDRPRVSEEFARGIQGHAYDTCYRVFAKGRLRWLHARAKLVERPDGSVYMAGICDDVTNEQLLSQSLAKTAQRLALAQNAAKVTTFEWNLLNDSVAFSGDMCFGRPVTEFRTSKDVFPLVLDEDREALSQCIAAALSDGKGYQHEFRVMAPDETILWYSTAGKPLPEGPNAATEVIGVNVDITMRKRSESRLIQSEKLAAVGRLASSIAHEINNPLEAVTNLLFLARQNATRQDVQGWLTQADLELRRVGAIANQTLRFHRQSSSPQPTSCLSLFTTALSLYEARLANNDIAVEKRKRANEPVLCFEGDLRQVLSNVVTNAIDAMPQGGRLLVRSREGTDWRTGRRGLILTIADTGHGMNSNIRKRAFEPFYTTKGIGGSGLGLWISSQIIERHSGRFLLRSSHGADCHGTTVCLFIPFDGAKRDSRSG